VPLSLESLRRDKSAWVTRKWGGMCFHQYVPEGVTAEYFNKAIALAEYVFQFEAEARSNYADDCTDGDWFWRYRQLT
jgi:hypothetical protein